MDLNQKLELYRREYYTKTVGEIINADIITAITLQVPNELINTYVHDIVIRKGNSEKGNELFEEIMKVVKKYYAKELEEIEKEKEQL